MSHTTNNTPKSKLSEPRFAQRLRLSVTFLHAVLSVAISIALCAHTTTARAADGGWALQPYRIQAVLAIDVPGGLADEWAKALPIYLQQRLTPP